MKNYNKQEMSYYFNRRKIGTINITDKKNIINNIDKQKYNESVNKIRPNISIHNISEKDFSNLKNQIDKIKIDYTKIKDNTKNKILKKNVKIIKNENEDNEDVWTKMYEKVKKYEYEKRPEDILRKKKKLLEYIIVLNVKKRKEFEKELFKSMT